MSKLKNASTTWRDKLTHTIQMATCTRNSNMEDVFVDPVKQSLPKIFLECNCRGKHY